jgi:hypothetical protein
MQLKNLFVVGSKINNKIRNNIESVKNLDTLHCEISKQLHPFASFYSENLATAETELELANKKEANLLKPQQIHKNDEMPTGGLSSWKSSKKHLVAGSIFLVCFILYTAFHFEFIQVKKSLKF